MQFNIFLNTKAIVLSFLLFSSTASATFSIIAYDPDSKQIGVALASCIMMPEDIPFKASDILNGIVPGKGVINTQATIDIPNINLIHAKELIDKNTQASTVIQYLVHKDSDPTYILERQYIALTINNEQVDISAYTGNQASGFTNVIKGDTYAIAGNLLTDPSVLLAMEFAFKNSYGELADKLMNALTSVRNLNIGDKRCQNKSVSSLSAFLRVAKASDSPDDLLIDLNYHSTDEQDDAITRLENALYLWKQLNQVP
ncbi:DUF1028 domain-containing protein [Spartinivicinus poritis]|uniref:DUF1028 domain-containing protein n=1 Tax=Spartinivicinus poritis TaxID=2994640 RepID=A0ABT5UG33_9GAMM|nr:DUF1028 domain-containing protein [Spartinivicinus sp. A2-2]MDE1464442.1 DUF1028 domain-containing protein [Spartinivicinus sp. A2-2]